MKKVSIERKKVSLEKHFLGLGKDSLIYGLGNAVIRVLALLTAPIFTRIFAPAEYGVISLIASVISFLSILLLFGMDNALFVSFYQYKKEKKEVVSSAFWFLLLWGLLIAGIASIFSNQISQLIFHNSLYKALFFLTFWTAYLTLLINISKTILRLEFRAKTFALITIINAVISTGLMIWFVVGIHKGLFGYFLGSFSGTLITFLVTIFLIKKNLSRTISFLRLKEMLSFGVYLLPASVAFFVFDLSDRFFLNHYRTLTELGLYSIGINIASLIVFFSYALGQAWSPQVLNIYYSNKRTFHQFVPRFFEYYSIFFFSLAVIITIFSSEILRILTTQQFFAASTVVGPLSLAMVFSASNQVTSLGITISRKTKYFASYTILAAILNIGLNFLLIPRYGMVGAAYATTSSYLFLTISYYFVSQKFIRIKLNLSKIIRLVGLSMMFILISPYTWQFAFWENLVLKTGEVAGFVVLLYLLGVIEKQELGYLKKYLLKMVKR